MQYILTEEERQALVPKADIVRTYAAIRALRDMVVGNDCIHKPGSRWTYCDQCPLSDIGNQSRVSDWELSRSMCDLRRNYSK